jgi:hypothetical protein
MKLDSEWFCVLVPIAIFGFVLAAVGIGLVPRELARWLRTRPRPQQRRFPVNVSEKKTQEKQCPAEPK